jgi:1-aminocyclopropane-1-carboxylate deaminase
MFTNIFSPLQQIAQPALRQLWVKRDDLIDPYISGNKWRKLKYVLEEAISTDKTHLVTFGGAYSNHLVATAAAAAKYALKSTAFVRGERVDNEMLLLCKLYGMDLRFTDRDSYKNKAELYKRYFNEDDTAYFIDEGGAGPQAIKGCEEIIDELPEDIDHIFCAAGTGTTSAGLLNGIINRNRKAILHVVPVLKAGDYIKKQILDLTGFSVSEAPAEKMVIHQDFHFGGYAKVNEELLNFMKNFIRDTGILIDPVYTAKLFYAINSLSETNYLDKDSKIVALHTGGLLGIFGMKAQLNRIV